MSEEREKQGRASEGSRGREGGKLDGRETSQGLKK